MIAQRFRRVLIHDHSGRHVKGWLSGLADYLRGDGAEVRVVSDSLYPGALRRSIRKNRGILCPLALRWWRKQVSQVDHVFVWNGEREFHQSIRQACRLERVPCSIVEVGYFPQKRYFTVDSRGINATSSLMDDSLDWVQAKHLDRVEDIRQAHLCGKRWEGDGGYVAVPLQMANDTNIVLHSSFSTMQEFIRHCEIKFPNQRVLFKKHPRDPGEYESMHPIHADGSFLDLAVSAKLVYGINSTCLLESVLLGAPTHSIGKGFISAHQHQLDKLLAALVDKQIPVNEKDMGYWLDKYCAER